MWSLKRIFVWYTQEEIKREKNRREIEVKQEREREVEEEQENDTWRAETTETKEYVYASMILT